jgi:HEAT repeat protein
VTKFARTLLQDREPAVRAQAAIALGAAGGPGVVPELEAMLLDSYPQVQLAAAKAILAATEPH